MNTKSFNAKDWLVVGTVTTPMRGHLQISIGHVNLPGPQVKFLDTDVNTPLSGEFQVFVKRTNSGGMVIQLEKAEKVIR